MRPRTFFLPVLVSLGLLLPVLAGAQPQTDNLRAELERTDRILDRAREQVQVSISATAGDFLRQARSIQSRAWKHFHQGGQGGAALGLTMKARDLARRAVETAEIEAKAYERVRDLIESTRDLVDEATSEVAESGDPQARRLLDGGIRQLQIAQEAYRAREYRKAIRLVTTARELIERAIQRARVAVTTSPLSIESAFERTAALLEEVRAALAESPNPKAQSLYEEAERLLARAADRHREGRDRLALRLVSQARQTALNALFLVERNPDRADVERALEVVEQLIDDLTPEILASESEKAKTLLDSARQRQREASGQLEAGNLARALDLARLADGLLRRAAEAAGIR